MRISESAKMKRRTKPLPPPLVETPFSASRYFSPTAVATFRVSACSSRTHSPPFPTTRLSPALTRKGRESQLRKQVYSGTAMRGIWLAGVATAASSTAAAGMPPPVTAAAAAAATAAFVPRGLGGALSRARLAGSRRSRSSPAAAATTAGFVIKGSSSTSSSTGRTSTWAAGTRQHVSTVAPARRPRPAGQSSFSTGWVATLGGKPGAGGVGVGGGSRPSRLMFSASAEADVGSATTQEPAAEGTHNEAAALSGEAREGGGQEAGPAPLKVRVERHR